jgi:hypothetical protein
LKGLLLCRATSETLHQGWRHCPVDAASRQPLASPTWDVAACPLDYFIRQKTYRIAALICSLFANLLRSLAMRSVFVTYR